MENALTQPCSTRSESQSVAATVTVVKKDVLLGVLFGGERLSKEDRKIIRAWLVTTAQAVDKRLYHTNKLSDRELVIRYMKDEDFKEALYIQAAFSSQPKITMVLIIILSIMAVLATEWPRLSTILSGNSH